MPKTLPSSADIAWLRKAAKSLLKTWKSDGRADKLSDAQFEIAKDYGFASWRALKAYFDGTPTADQADAFLAKVGRGDMMALRAALNDTPALVNCVGSHPYWGGRPHALHVAIDTNRKDVFDLLIAAGADIEGRGADYDNWSPLMLALSWGRESMAKTLTEKDAHEGICVALLRGDDSALNRHLSQDGWQQARLPSGSLIGLARTPHAVRQLIKAGVSPKDQDRWGSDAMEALSRLGKKGHPLVTALADHGTQAPPEAIARLGDRKHLEKLAAKDPSILSDPKVLTAAVDFSHIDLVEWLLTKGANVNARHDFEPKGTALHSAAWNGNAEMVKCLLNNGADTSAVDAEHRTTPLVWAKTARQVTNNKDCDDVIALLE